MSFSEKNYLSFLYTEGIYKIKEQNPLPPQKTITSSVTEENASPPLEEIKFIGGNKKNVFILLNGNNTEIINDKEKTFLLKVLQAVNCSLEDVAIVSYGNTLNEETIKDQFKPSVFISFGLELNLINKALKITKYQPSNQNGVNFLLADPLSAIESDVEKKKLLWKAIQILFK